MIFIIFLSRIHFDAVKSLSAELAVLLGSGADLEDGRVVCNHTILPSQREGLDLPALATFLFSQGADIRLGGIDGEQYQIPSEEE